MNRDAVLPEVLIEWFMLIFALLLVEAAGKALEGKR